MSATNAKPAGVVRHTMRPYIFLLALIIYHTVSGQSQKKIARLKIYRIDKTTQFLNKPAFFTTYYDSTGRIIKEIEKFNYDSSITTTETKYLTDSLISQLSVDTFINKAHLGTTIINYSYKFDESRRVIENMAVSSTGEQTKECYSYNGIGMFDTVLVFNNDTSVRTGNFFTSETQLKSTLSLKRIKKYSYDGDKVVVEDCCYPVENVCCETNETTTSDTLEVYTNRFWGMQGHILNSAQTVWTYKIHKRNELEYHIEQPNGSHSYSTFKLDKNGLVTRQKTKTVNRKGKKHYLTTDYQYYFKQ